jgi:probable rRNA maturation factor
MTGMTNAISIDVIDACVSGIDPDVLRRAARAVVERHLPPADGTQGCALTIVIETDDAVAALNAQFRGIAAPTDVLSFPAEKPPVVDPDEPDYLGDVIIAYPYAQAQAEREGHAVLDDLRLLVVHGVLHLLGYDHGTMEERARMWAEQEQILRALGVDPGIVPALERYQESSDEQDHDRN